MKLIVETMEGYTYVSSGYADAKHLHDNVTIHGEMIVCDNNILIGQQFVKIIYPMKEETK